MDIGRDDEAAQELKSEELAFTDGDESLPWLVGEDDEELPGVDPVRIAIAVGLGVLLLAILLGGLYWLSRDKAGADIVADGSTIEAPDVPIKEKPEDPGGSSFQGAADTTAAVAEGEIPEGRLAEDNPPVSSGEAPPAEDKIVTTGVAVQVAAYSSRQRAEQGWGELLRRYEVLSGVSHRVVEGQADIGKVYRLQAITADRSAANALCDGIKAAGGACQVK